MNTRIVDTDKLSTNADSEFDIFLNCIKLFVNRRLAGFQAGLISDKELLGRARHSYLLIAETE